MLPLGLHEAKGNNFNLLRLIAALQVLFGHTLMWLKLPLYSYTLTKIFFTLPGVPIFFTISGFLISKTYLENDKKKIYFFINRALRIYPALWCCFLLILILFFVTGGIDKKFMFSPDFYKFSLIQYLTASIDVASALFHIDSVYWFNNFYKIYPLPVTWSLTVELCFYLLIPLIYLPFHGRKSGRLGMVWFFTWFLLSFVCCILYKYALLHAQDKVLHLALFYWQQNIFTFLWMFMVGALLYLYFDKLRFLLVGKFFYWLIIYLSYMYIVSHFFEFNYSNYMSDYVFSSIQLALLAILTISAAYSGGYKLSRFLGKYDLSYGIYLFHMPIIMTLVYLGFQHDVWLLPLVILLAGMIAFLSWMLIERKALLLKQMLLQRKSYLAKNEMQPMSESSKTL